MQKTELSHGATLTPKIKFPYKAVCDVWPTHIIPGCEYSLRSYTWRHNEVLEIFAETAKICCETVNKALNNIINRAIQFVKEEKFSKLSHRNKHRSSLLDGCMDWHVAIDLEHHFVFPTENSVNDPASKYCHFVRWIKQSFRYGVKSHFWRKFRLGTSA